MADLEEESMENSLGEYPFNSMSTLGYKEKSEIVVFEQLCQDAEVDDVLSGRNDYMIHRRSSIHGTSISGNSDCKDKCSFIDIHRQRRHSSYNPRNRKIHRDAHADMEEYLVQFQQNKNHKLEKRSGIVNSLLEFHASYELSFAASSQPDVSLGLQYSCPVLTYLQDSDEDSVEVRIVKRPTFHHEYHSKLDNESSRSIHQNGEEDFEIPAEGGSDLHRRLMESDDYTLEIPEMMEPDQPTLHRKRRKPHSYQVLERRLSSESPLSVLRALMQKDGEEFNLQGQEDLDETSMVSTNRNSLDSQNSESLQRENDCTESSTNLCARVA